jgi:Protein of unknown function (DUF1579)
MVSFASSLLRIAGLVCLGFVSISTSAQVSADTPTSVTPLMRQMPGTWEVQARMWPGPDAKAVALPPAIAHRDLIRNAYLRETMEPEQSSEGPPFTRVAYFSYNWINQQYEYFSLDSRLPQMMSYAIPGANKTHDGRIDLVGTTFVAPEWGADKNVPFMYRLAIGPIEGDKQVAQLFLTRQSGEGGEFLAFEYIYRRRN